MALSFVTSVLEGDRNTILKFIIKQLPDTISNFQCHGLINFEDVNLRDVALEEEMQCL